MSSETTFEESGFLSAIIAIRRRRRKVNKVKRQSAEINYLNIVAMMDMMTIILVFLLKSISFSAGGAGVESILLPLSSTQAQPLEAIKVFVTKDTIVVEDKLVARLENHVIVSQYLSKENPYEITALKMELDKKAEEFVNLLKLNPNYPVQSDLTIIADKNTPYRVLMQIFYSASKASAQKDDQEFSFSKFRLTVLRQEF